jgi:L-ascorbate metabolism protein UlaG (beta-lactamase superfamily)
VGGASNNTLITQSEQPVPRMAQRSQSMIIATSSFSSRKLAARTDSSAKLAGVRITKFTHSCVRVEHRGATLVIDPGVWSEPGALFGADAVLVTHEHVDHIDELRLAGLGVPVFAPAGAAIRQLPFVELLPGQEFRAAGVPVTAVGGQHAEVYGGQPDCPNLGYLIEDLLYHPGDALHVPERPVETLLVPVQASWLRTREAIDFVRAVEPRRTFPIHDGQVNERGLASVNGWLAEQTDHGFRWLVPRQTV